ncbi:MAG: ABC transporter permease [archaeon]
MLKDYFKIAVNSILHRKLRSWLTMIGIFIGIAAVVALISLGQGMQNAVNAQFGKVGANRIMVSPGGAIAGPLSDDLGSGQLYNDDVDAIKRVKGVEFATGTVTKIAEVKFGDETQYISVMGFDTDTETARFMGQLGFFDIEFGREIKSGATTETVAGYKVAKDLFDKKLVVGNNIYIEGTKFSIVGVQKNAGTGIHDALFRIPKDTAEELFAKENPSTIFVKVRDGYDPPSVADDISKTLRKEHDVEEGKEDFAVQLASDVIASFNSILIAIQVVIIGIAAISIVVGAVGITNTMYTSVLERTQEIGIMKAIGARNSSILKIFLIESGLLGLIGGAIGILIGTGLAKVVEIIAAQALGSDLLKAYFPWYLILGALLFSFIMGAVAGTTPARQASKMNPTDALRYE